MPAEDWQRVRSVTIRGCIELLTVEEREDLSAAEFLCFFREHGFVVGEACRTMVERLLGGEGEPLDYDALIAAADEFVARCDGSTEDAVHVLEAYALLSGDKAASTAHLNRVESGAQEARIAPR
jgi:hypothetical protein